MKLKTLYPILILGFILIMFGILFNFLVISNNGGKMPVKLNYHYETKTHISYKNIDENGLKLEYEHFADRYQINKPFSNKIIYYSIGDLLLFIGGLLFAITHFNITYKLYIKKHRL